MDLRKPKAKKSNGLKSRNFGQAVGFLIQSNVLKCLIHFRFRANCGLLYTCANERDIPEKISKIFPIYELSIIF